MATKIFPTGFSTVALAVGMVLLADNGAANVAAGSLGAAAVGVLNSTNQLSVPLGTTIQPTFFNLTGSIANYGEINVQNTLANAASSSDITATADNGTASTHYANFGINSSLGGSTPFTGANAVYLYSSDNELDIAAGTVTGATPQVNIYLGTIPNLVAQFASTGMLLGDYTTPSKQLKFKLSNQTASTALTVDTGAQTASWTLSVPVLAANDTLVTLGGNQTFTGTWAQSLTSASTAALTVDSTTVTFSGAATTGPMVGIGSTVTSTGTIATAGIYTNATYGSVVANPGGAVAAIFYAGGTFNCSSTASASLNLTAASMVGHYSLAQFSGSAISGTSLALLAGEMLQPSIVMTQASGSTTISAVYGIYVLPSTFSTATGGATTTVTNYYGIYLGTLTTSGSGTTTITGRYGVYQQDAAAANVFAGSQHAFGLTTLTAGAISHLGTAGFKTIVAATQDGMQILGRAGGTSSFFAQVIPGVLTASITLTTPLASGTLTTGSGAANQVGTWSGTNALVGAATLTLTTTSGAALLANAAGTSTATTTTAGLTQSITYSGIFTTGPVSSISGSSTCSGATATAAVILTGVYGTMSATGAITNSAGVAGVYGNLAAAPTGAATTTYSGIQAASSVTSAANVFFAGSTLLGANINTTFNTANTTGAAVAAAVAGVKITHGIATTNASATNTLAAVYGLWISPGTFSSTGGGGLTIATLAALKIENTTLTTMTATARYAIYSLDTANSSFAGGLFSTSATGGIGYATGAGGTVVQGTSRATGVTLSKMCGQITLFTAAGSATPATFVVTNTSVVATDIISIVDVSGSSNVYVWKAQAAAGSFTVTFWTTGGVASDTPVIAFSVSRAATA